MASALIAPTQSPVARQHVWRPWDPVLLGNIGTVRFDLVLWLLQDTTRLEMDRHCCMRAQRVSFPLQAPRLAALVRPATTPLWDLHLAQTVLTGATPNLLVLNFVTCAALVSTLRVVAEA